jgi:uncharacterized membrane protein HdeD (DUF308 family)
MDLILSGALALGLGVAGLFFLRFWRDAGDRLFALFALAFFVMAINRVQLGLSVGPEAREWNYWVRFIAFALILAAILDKNRPRRQSGAG